MRLLTEEERLKVDTKPDVIKKWDKFLKEAVYNLGYGNNIIDNMYPYDRGLPMKGTDERLPVGPTGRIFFKMSNADKLAQMFSVITRTGNASAATNVSYFLNHFLGDEATWNLLYPEEEMPDTDEERKQKFIEDCDIFQILTNYADSVANTRWLKEDEKEQFVTGMGNREQSLAFMLFFEPWEEDYSSSIGTRIKNQFEYALQNTLNGYNISTETYTKLIKNSEVYTQDYLVLSLNPIDKLMLSTKQAFGSCMSIAKQCDTSGTSSGPAFGLPAMFNTDSVWLTFMTSGKHKNMYWEKVEWEKQAEDRNPEKAYKYLKMTCRALTYQGTMSYASLKSYASLNSYEALEPDKDKLFVGRQYSANGEDFTWQKMIEVLMARYGIATAHAYVKELGTKLSMPACNVLNRGTLSGRAPITFDRFGQVRGYYYDNLRIHLIPTVTTARDMVQDNFKRGFKLEENVEVKGDTEIQTGSSRSGSGGIASYYNPKPGLDMFKMMLGEQNYSYLNMNVRICSKCGEVIEKVAGTDKNNEPVCLKCAEKLELKICLHCNRLYSEDEADEHKEVDLADLINDDPERKVKPVIVCKTMLRQASVDQQEPSSREKVICGHCGKITNIGSLPYNMRGYHDTMTYEDVTFKVVVCYECFSKAYICDKCKKLIFIETNQDAALLLPNRRVICKDCIDSIRIKKERREEIRSVLNNILTQDAPEATVLSTEVEFTEDYLLKNTTKRILSQHQNFNKAYGTGKFKDVMKQFRSWVQAHPGKYMHIKPVEAPKEAPVINEELVERIEEYIGV